jgi:putative hemolysin
LFDVAIYGGLVVLFGQVFPRAIARQWPAQVIPFVLPVLRVTEIITTPILALGRSLADPLIRRRGRGATPPERDAIQDLLREGELEGVGEHDEIAIISGVVEFGEKLVRDVMTPRGEVFALAEDTDPHSLAIRIAQSAYSRVPIFRESLDQIVGMVHAFDVLKARGEALPPIRPVAFATPETHCNELLFRMLRERLHLAVVQSREGMTLGIVTLEDLLEELVGDIRDEHDEPDVPRGRTAGQSS